MRSLTGLASGPAAVTLRVLPQNHHAAAPAEAAAGASCDTVLAAPECCARDKFKLTSLVCT